MATITLLSFKTYFFFYGDQKRLCITIMTLHYHVEIKVSGSPEAYQFTVMKINPAIATLLCFMCPSTVLIHSVTVFTNTIYSKSTTLEQHKILSLIRLEVWWGSHWSKVPVPGKPASSLGCRGIHFLVPSVFWRIPNLLVHIFPFLPSITISVIFFSIHSSIIRFLPDQSPERHNTSEDSCDETGTQADSSESPN